MPSSTVENYIKQIYLEQQREPGSFLRMKKLATAMGISPGTATTMVKGLARSGLVIYQPRSGSRLTPQGEALALQVLRRHRLIELFLVEVLGLDWSEVHREADKLEHVISERVLERIDRLLNTPQVDPHGDPIPTALGRIDKTEFQSLSHCRAGDRVRIVRITEQAGDFLKFVERQGLVPGMTVQVESCGGAAEAVTVKTPGQAAVALGMKAADKILVDYPEANA